jgi:hypothetical protein
VNHENCDIDVDGVEVMDEPDEDDDISDLLRDLAGGLDDRGDFEHNSPDLDPCEELVAEFHEDGAYANNSNEYEYVLVDRTNLAPPVQQPHRSSSSPFVQPNTYPTASSMQRPHSRPIPTTRVVQPPQTSLIPTDSVVQTPQSSPDGVGPSRNGDANHVSHDDYVMFSSLFFF